MKGIRRYDLDWLRVIVFALLIFYHVGMFFVPWGWHIKNNHIYEWIKWPMLFLNQWRLPILFVISGMGTYYAFSKRNLCQFSWERIRRLGIPLIFGMLFIVPPQVYLERLTKNQFSGSYWDYFTSVAFNGVYPEGNVSWHHLWFLPYLLIFSLLLGPVFIYLLKKEPGFINWIKKIFSKTFGLYWLIIPLYLLEACLEPFFDITHALIDDWFNFSFSLVLFFYGFLLISAGNVFWTSVDKIKSKALLVGIFTFFGQVFIWIFLEDGYLVHFTEALLKVGNIWSWILVLFGYSAKYLNRKSNSLTYANRAVYPFYILHQTITIILAYFLMDLSWGLFPKASILILGTFGFSWFIYHFIILKTPLLQPFLGLKKKRPK
ncbi:acyltransferase family protein [Maribacter sp. PR1]|uniref:Acyltransferase family protein n=1 Tax=Maribacter cobaltidurans TaxID=1178778 RepID=A0ABU7IRQ2_9FLAO|nr:MULTISPECIES: acyltransferase family protein [Maribacter]MDC6388261.1 acyltransferase family protein [Maribacter sp. PR1]MEE1975649.1 acyltransferase family protein [Maribacter cobaltidurans]